MDSGGSSPIHISTFIPVNAPTPIASHAEVQKPKATGTQCMTDLGPSWAKGLGKLPYSKLPNLTELRKELGIDKSESSWHYDAFCDDMNVFVKNTYTRELSKNFNSFLGEWRDNQAHLKEMAETFVATRSANFWPDFNRWSREEQDRIKRLVMQLIFKVKLTIDRNKKYKGNRRARFKKTAKQGFLHIHQDQPLRVEDSESRPTPPTRTSDNEATLNRACSESSERSKNRITAASREWNDETPQWARDLGTLEEPDIPLMRTLEQQLQHPQWRSKKQGRISHHVREFLKQGSYQYGQISISWVEDLKILASITEAFVAQRGNKLWPRSSRGLCYGVDDDAIKQLVMQLCFRVFKDCFKALETPKSEEGSLHDTPEHNTILAIPDESELVCTPIMDDGGMSNYDGPPTEPSINFIYRVVHETEEQGHESRTWYSEGNFLQKAFLEVKQELNLGGDVEALTFTLRGKKINSSEHVLYDDERRFKSAQEYFREVIGKFLQLGESQVTIVVRVM